MRKQGILKRWNDDKGFGFINDINSGADVFIHISAFQDQGFRPQANQIIFFTLSKDKQGRLRASNAYIEARKNTTKQTSKYRASYVLSVGFSITFLITTAVLVISQKLPWLILYLYLMLSITSFVFYRMDKIAAQQRYWRTPESALHLMSLFCGWPGALIAQQTLRHKSSKLSFRIKFILTMLINLAAFAWLFTEQGESIIGFVDASIKNAITELFELIKTRS